MRFEFDIVNSDKTVYKFIQKYTDKQIDDHFDFNDLMINVINNKLWKNDNSIFDNTFKIGDNISVDYCPYSQKYIDYYEEQGFEGKIIFIDNENNNMFVMLNEPDSIIIKSLERLGCHYFGMTPSYTFFIKKLRCKC